MEIRDCYFIQIKIKNSLDPNYFSFILTNGLTHIMSRNLAFIANEDMRNLNRREWFIELSRFFCGFNDQMVFLINNSNAVCLKLVSCCLMAMVIAFLVPTNTANF